MPALRFHEYADVFVMPTSSANVWRGGLIPGTLPDRKLDGDACRGRGRLACAGPGLDGACGHRDDDALPASKSRAADAALLGQAFAVDAVEQMELAPATIAEGAAGSEAATSRV
ncbi:MAG: hypothetical protein LC744_04865 [Chloroflexi bacterium]|nr:hypothetical protein [Chloroflexota bacterium]